MIQDQLKKIGVQATPRQIEFNTLASQTADGQFAAAMIGFTMDTSLDLKSNYHSKSIGEGANVARWIKAIGARPAVKKGMEVPKQG